LNNYFSNIELYFSEPENLSAEVIKIQKDDFKHLIKVMRHKMGDRIYITNGCGKIFETSITRFTTVNAEANVKRLFEYKNEFENIFFCIPKLKNSDRFEFILEKCTELGITNFIVFNADKAMPLGNKPERWNKILLAAMKQSLRAFLPKIFYAESLDEIIKKRGTKFVFDQNAANEFNRTYLNNSGNSYFVFGPEGGLSEKELSLFEESSKYNIAHNRLRTETAIIKCAALL